MRKILAISLVLILCLLTGCQRNHNQQSISGSVSITYGDQIIISEEITTTGVTAEDVLLEVCQKNKIHFCIAK